MREGEEGGDGGGGGGGGRPGRVAGEEKCWSKGRRRRSASRQGVSSEAAAAAAAAALAAADPGGGLRLLYSGVSVSMEQSSAPRCSAKRDLAGQGRKGLGTLAGLQLCDAWNKLLHFSLLGH